MKKINLKLGISISILTIISVFAICFIFLNNKPTLVVKSTYKESTYVDLTSTNAMMILKNPKYTSEIVNSSDIIIKGQITASSKETITNQLQEGTPEKAIADKRDGKSTYTVTRTNYTIKISDIIKGNKLGESITLCIPDVYKELVPILQNGDNYVFCLNWNKDLGKYIYGHPSASFYKVDKDDTIKSIYSETSDFYDLTGKKFNKLKAKFSDEIKTDNK